MMSPSESPTPPAPLPAAPPDADFAALVERFCAPLYRFGLALTGDAARAAELTRRAFSAANLRGGNPAARTRAKLRLFGALLEEFLRVAPPRARQFGHGGDGPVSLPASGDFPWHEARKIEETCRVPLLLHYSGIFSGGEIAEVLRIPVGEAFARLACAKAELRARLLPPTVAAVSDRH